MIWCGGLRCFAKLPGSGSHSAQADTSVWRIACVRMAWRTACSMACKTGTTFRQASGKCAELFIPAAGGDDSPGPFGGAQGKVTQSLAVCPGRMWLRSAWQHCKVRRRSVSPWSSSANLRALQTRLSPSLRTSSPTLEPRPVGDLGSHPFKLERTVDLSALTIVTALISGQ